MEQLNTKRVAIFVVSACLIGMVVGSAVTLLVLNVQSAIPSWGLMVAVNVGICDKRQSICVLWKISEYLYLHIRNMIA